MLIKKKAKVEEAVEVAAIKAKTVKIIKAELLKAEGVRETRK